MEGLCSTKFKATSFGPDYVGLLLKLYTKECNTFENMCNILNLDSKFVIVSKISCNYPWFSKNIFLQTEANFYSVKSDIWLILERMFYIRSAIILINTKHTQIVSQLVTSLKKDRLFFNLSADTDVTSYSKAENKREELSYREAPFLTLFVSGFIYLMLRAEAWVYSSFVVVPTVYFKILVDKRN